MARTVLHVLSVSVHRRHDDARFDLHVVFDILEWCIPRLDLCSQRVERIRLLP